MRPLLFRERVAIFVDGWNLSVAMRNGFNKKVDYRALLETLRGDRPLLRAYIYLGSWTDETLRLLLHREQAATTNREHGSMEENGGTLSASDEAFLQQRRDNERRFRRMLSRSGFRVVEKPIKVFADGNMKADLDLELAIDMLTLADYCDSMILVSGDSDFVPVIDAVGKRGVHVTVVSTLATEAWNSTPERYIRFPARASDALVDAADDFIDLRDILDRIEYHPDRNGDRVHGPAPEDPHPVTST